MELLFFQQKNCKEPFYYNNPIMIHTITLSNKGNVLFHISKELKVTFLNFEDFMQVNEVIYFSKKKWKKVKF